MSGLLSHSLYTWSHHGVSNLFYNVLPTTTVCLVTDLKAASQWIMKFPILKLISSGIQLQLWEGDSLGNSRFILQQHGE